MLFCFEIAGRCPSTPDGRQLKPRPKKKRRCTNIPIVIVGANEVVCPLTESMESGGSAHRGCAVVTSRIICLLLVATTVSFGQEVRYNFASGDDFSKYKTFKWVQINGAQQLNQIADEQLKTAVNTELGEKGLSVTTADDAGLYIGYQVSLGQEKQFTSYNTDWGYGPGWRYGWYGAPGGGMSTTTSSTIHTGQIDLDMYDPAQKKLVWRGTASKAIDTNAKPGKREKNLNKAVAKLLKSYPPPQKKG